MIFEPKSSFLVQVTHTTMGALAVLMACARLLELRLTPPAARVAGLVSILAMLLIALVLVFYREANVVVPADGGVAPRSLARSLTTGWHASAPPWCHTSRSRLQAGGVFARFGAPELSGAMRPSFCNAGTPQQPDPGWRGSLHLP